MIDNQLIAQLLYNHQLATQEQIMACWPKITPEKDLGVLLVEQGVLAEETYKQMLAYMQTLSPQAAEASPPAPAKAATTAGTSSSEGVPAAKPRPSMQDFVIEPAAQRASIEPPPREPGIVDYEEPNWSPAPDEGKGKETIEPIENTDAPKRGFAIPDDAYVAPKGVEEKTAHASKPAEVKPAAAHGHKTDDAAKPGHAETAATKPQGVSPQARRARQDAPVSDPPKQAPESVGPDSTWEQLLAFARHHDAADLHLSAGNPILLRRYGALQAATSGPMEQKSLRVWVERALTADQLKDFEAKGDLEFIYTLNGWGRYRVTLLKQRRGWDVTARVIPSHIRSMEESGMPESCRDLTKWAQGLVLVTGPVGCGKSSTLATLVEMVNQERHDHIISIEEPIEFVFEPAHCRITQRQIGPHTLSRDAALRAALREDPDIIVISELRDLDTIRLAVSAAETGHLVFGTMNTTNASRTLNRLVDSFPPEEQGIVRNMISESLRGVISQQLVPRKDGQGMLPAYEVLLVNTAVANMIRKDEAHQLGTAMLTGKSSGMVLLDDSLKALVERGYVDPNEAMMRATNPKEFEKYAGRR